MPPSMFDDEEGKDSDSGSGDDNDDESEDEDDCRFDESMKTKSLPNALIPVIVTVKAPVMNFTKWI